MTTKKEEETVVAPIADTKKEAVPPVEAVAPEVDGAAEGAVANEGVVEAPVTEAAPEETDTSTQSSRDKIVSVLKRFYPEVVIDDNPDSLMDALLPFVEKIVQFHDDLNEVVEEYPEFGDFLVMIRQGYSPAEAIASSFDEDELIPVEGTPDAEALAKAKQGRRKKVEELKAWNKKVKENSAVTETNLDEAAKEAGIDDATKKNVGLLMVALIKDATTDGVITKENWVKFINGTRHEDILAEKDKEIENALEDGKIAGRNQQIEKKRKNKEKGDMLPKLTSSGTPKNESNKPKDDFGLAKLANKKSVL